MRGVAGTIAALVAALAVAAVAFAEEAPTREQYVTQVEPVCQANTVANKRILHGARDRVKHHQLSQAGGQFIRAAAAYDVCARMAYAGASLEAAAQAVIMQTLPPIGGRGGLIAVDCRGNFAMPFNTEGMYRAWIGRDGEVHVAIFPDKHAS